ncbi:MAG: RraA family protein [candidate division KSB1 bacterium]|nr:RraA family protein [candidate division KSB1 bacterium]
MLLKRLIFILMAGLFIVQSLYAQVGVFSKEDIIKYTPQWEGERFPDGRPRVADELLERLKSVSIEEAWAVCRRHGFHNQFEGDWVITENEPVLTGRAVTACFHPKRPDVDAVIDEQGEKDGRIGAQNSWIIDTLADGDVIVVDLMGKVVDGTYLGDNLANSIWVKTGGTGVVIDGGARDIEGVKKIKDFPIFNRGWHPSYLDGAMLMGINSPIRIGHASVMPGDAVLGKEEGVIFIPAHLVEETVQTSEIIRLRDEFGHQMLRQGEYTPGQIDSKWTEEIEEHFRRWLQERDEELTEYQREKLLKGRTW